MEQLTFLAQRYMRDKIREGEYIIDATAGNGWDTLFLAKQVGARGKVYAFDIQASALKQTHTLLAQEKITWVKLMEASHTELKMFIPAEYHGRISGAMFNLGYLPGGNKEITTLGESTTQALRMLNEILKPGARVTIIAYPGHSNGATEIECLEEFFNTDTILNGYQLNRVFPTGEKSPRLYVLDKN